VHFLWTGASDAQRDKERWQSWDLTGRIRLWLIKSGMEASKRQRVDPVTGGRMKEEGRQRWLWGSPGRK
jgi:hypothetical protein